MDPHSPTGRHSSLSDVGGGGEFQPAQIHFYSPTSSNPSSLITKTSFLENFPSSSSTSSLLLSIDREREEKEERERDSRLDSFYRVSLVRVSDPNSNPNPNPLSDSSISTSTSTSLSLSLPLIAKMEIDICKQWLRAQADITIRSPFHEHDLAYLLVVIVGQITGEITDLSIPRRIDDDCHHLQQTDQSDEGRDVYPPPWDLEVLMSALIIECHNYLFFNWVRVFRNFDTPILSFKKSESYKVLLLFFMKISKSPIPMTDLLLADWINKRVQFEFILVISNLPKVSIDYADLGLVSCDWNDELGGSYVPSPPNLLWRCFSVYLTLLNISNHFSFDSSLQKDVFEVLLSVGHHYSECSLLSLCHIAQDPLFAVECPAQVFRLELLKILLGNFTGLPSSRPTSFIIMKKLESINPECLVYILRLAMKRARTFLDVNDIDSKLAQFDSRLVARLEAEATFDEILSLWVVRADRGELNLAEKLGYWLNRNSDLIVSLLKFAKHHVGGLRQRSHSNGGLLSTDSLLIILREAKANNKFIFDVSTDLASLESYLIVANQRRVSTLAPVGRDMSSFFDLTPPSSSDSSDVRFLHQASPRSQQQQQQQQQQPLQLQQQQQQQEVRARAGNIASSNANGTSNTSIASFAASTNGGYDEVEEMANSCFHQLYVGDLNIGDCISTLKRLKLSADKKEQDVFRVMIQNLFDEYRFFHKYRDIELKITADLFGSIIQNQLISSITLGIALRYVLEALRRDPDTGVDSKKIFLFGKIALEKFRTRLCEWPQYCTHLLQIHYLRQHAPEILHDSSESLSNPNVAINDSRPYAYTGAATTSSTGAGKALLSAVVASNPRAVVAATSASTISSSAAANSDMSKNQNYSNALLKSQKSATLAPHLLLESLPSESALFSSPSNLGFSDDRLFNYVIDRLVVSNKPIVLLGQLQVDVCNKVKDTFASMIDQVTITAKIPYLKFLLLTQDDFSVWFADLLLSRVCYQLDSHKLYLAILDQLDLPQLHKIVLNNAYCMVATYLSSQQIVFNANLRSVLRNLGSWIGKITLSQNKPILTKNLDLKCLLLWGYENECLIAVIPFVARTLEGVSESKVFRPPNPWTLGVLGIMKEIFNSAELKNGTKFDILVLFRNISVKIEDVVTENHLVSLHQQKIISLQSQSDHHVAFSSYSSTAKKATETGTNGSSSNSNSSLFLFENFENYGFVESQSQLIIPNTGGSRSRFFASSPAVAFSSVDMLQNYASQTQTDKNSSSSSWAGEEQSAYVNNVAQHP